jgi:glycosyltransferase involved in cell wall biosynthesis
MKKVLVCKSSLLPYSETFIREQVAAYRGWEPVLVGFRRLACGLPLESLSVVILDPDIPQTLAQAYRKVLTELSAASSRSVARLKQQSPALVHIHFGTDAVSFWPIVRQLNVPVVITLHGSDINIYREWWERGWLRLGNARYPQRLLRLSRQQRVHFVAVSHAIRVRAIEYGIPADRISVRYIGIDLGRFRFCGRSVSERPRRILYVGRLVEKKGGEYLIRAFARLRNIVPDVQLALIGDGPLAGPYKQLAQQLDVPVEFLGRRDSEAVKREIDNARVFCLPSVVAENGDAEGLGISILEAQACGVPVVTSARGGSTEGILNGVTGISFPERDIEALTRALQTILVNDDMALRMSRAATQFMARRFDIASCTRDLEGLYETLLSANGKSDTACT